MQLAIFDFETTDSNPDTARVTEMAVAMFDSETKRVTQTFSTLMHDETYEKIHPMASAITGLTDEFLALRGQAPRAAFAQLGAFFSRADFVVGHNIRNYDLKVLSKELERNLIEIELRPSIDTRFDIEYPAHIETRKLAYLALEHGIYGGKAHAALNDVMLTADLLFKYDIDRTIELSKSPDIWVRADVTYDQRDLAKVRKYAWFGEQKIWAKQIKELHYDKEKTGADFPVLLLPNFKG